MADDEDKPKKHTLDTLFIVYSNHKAITGELENEQFDCILLSQLDAWLEQAKLMPVPFTRVQTGLLYMRYKKWRLEYEDFLEMLQQLCTDCDLNLDDIKEQMVEAGVPTGGTDMVMVK